MYLSAVLDLFDRRIVAYKIWTSNDNRPMKDYWDILKSQMYYLKNFTSKKQLTKAIEDYIFCTAQGVTS